MADFKLVAGALAWQSPKAGKEWAWCWVFPLRNLSLDKRAEGGAHGVTRPTLRRHRWSSNTMDQAARTE